MEIRVPGKFLLFGEYAVAQGGLGVSFVVPKKNFKVKINSQSTLYLEDPRSGNLFTGNENAFPSFFQPLQNLIGSNKFSAILESDFHPFLGLGTSSAAFVGIGKFLKKDLAEVLKEYREFYKENSGYDVCTQYLEKNIVFENFSYKRDLEKDFPRQVKIYGLPFKAQSKNIPNLSMSEVDHLNSFSRAYLEDPSDIKNIFRENRMFLKKTFPETKDFFNGLEEIFGKLEFKPLGALGGDLVAVVIEEKNFDLPLLNPFI